METSIERGQPTTESSGAGKTEGIRRFILDREGWFSGFGSVCKTMVKCGKSDCKCARGQKHGPYYVLYWRDGEGKAKRRYLGGPGFTGPTDTVGMAAYNQ